MDFNTKASIAEIAECMVGKTAWSKAGCRHDLCGEWKCNLFVADVVKWAERSVPHRWVE